MVPRRGVFATASTFRESLLSAAQELDRPLSSAECAAFEAHYRLLLHWGRRINLTGLRSEGTIIRRHFIEPIAASRVLGGEGTLLDLGSGNGFPAIPLKVLRPGLRLILVESSERKCAFLWAVIREARLRDCRVETRRVRSRDDLVGLIPCRYLTYRGIKGLEILRRGGAIRLLEPGGLALLFLTESQSGELEKTGIPGLEWIEARSLPSHARSVVALLAPGP